MHNSCLGDTSDCYMYRQEKFAVVTKVTQGQILYKRQKRLSSIVTNYSL